MGKVEALQEMKVLFERKAVGSLLASAHDALKSYPQDRNIAALAANSFLLAKRPKEALTLFDRVRKLDLDTSGRSELDVLVGMSRALILDGQAEQATDLLKKVEQQVPNRSSVYAALANASRVLEKEGDQQRFASKAFKINPEDEDAIYEYALALVKLEQKLEALKVVEKNVYKAVPHGDSIDVWIALLKDLDKTRVAFDELMQLSDNNPEILEFCYGAAAIGHSLGEFALARPYFQRALELSPKNYRIYYEFGVMERVAGQLDQSDELVAQSLQLRPDNPAALRTFGSDIRYSYGDDNARRLLYAAANITNFSKLDQIHMHYALAKYHEDVVELDAAFRHYAVGGAKKLEQQPYDHSSTQQMADKIISVVTQKNISDTGLRGFPSKKPVFILGMPRSGTSLLEQILSSHPEVFGAGELKLMSNVLENIPVGVDGRILLGNREPFFKYEERAGYAERGEAFVERLEKLAGGNYERIVDKMPGNASFVGLIHAILPEAKIVHSRRHPVETCLSCYRIHFAEGQQWSYNLRHLGQYYRRYWELMEHWRREFPGVMHEVYYERNVLDFERQSRQLLDYLELDWVPQIEAFHETKRAVKTASVTQVRRPLYTTSVNRWKKFEEYLQPLLDEISDIIEEYEAQLPDVYGGSIAG